MILMVLKQRWPLPTPEEAMHDFLEEQTTPSLTKELGDTSTGVSHFSQPGGYRGQGRGRGQRGGHGGQGGCSGHGGPSGSSGTGDSHECECTYCKIDSHTTDAWWKQKRAQEGGNNDERICFQCGLSGKVKVDHVSYKCIKEWRKGKNATATAALATTGDCDPF